VRESSVPVLVDVPRDSNITDLLVRQAQKPSNPALFSGKDATGAWQDVRASEFLAEVSLLAQGLAASGVQPGDRVLVMARTRYEWSLADFAIWFAGAVSVPVYETSSASQVGWILADSGAVAAFAESPRHEELIRHATGIEGLPDLRHIWNFDDGGLDTLRAAGAEGAGTDVEERRSRAGLEDLATIIYTSGTTGKPKGCELTHGNFVELSENAAAALPQVAHEGARTIMFLPLAHVFARFISVLCVTAGVTVAHTADVKNLLPDLQSYRPTFILAVPRVFEKVYNNAMLKAEDAGKGKIFHAGANTAIEWSRAEQDGTVSLGLKLRHALFDRLLYRKIRSAMGGQVQHAVSGGAPLGERLGHFFHGIGLMVLEGYGLTETTAPVAVNTPRRIRIGTVGAPLPGNAVRIADDGEILARGVCLMKGYYKLPELSAEAFTDGWFHTGDLGELDADGFLKVTGRKKEIIVTAGGKNVVPSQLEDPIRANALVSQCVVLGDHRPFIAALITLDEEALPGWLERHSLPASTTIAEAAGHPLVQAEVQRFVDEANGTVSQAETIKRFRIAPTDFTEASGHLTPSLKIRRAQVLQDYAEAIEEMYSAPRP
jgi:long-chain acyl-CoA synthetase